MRPYIRAANVTWEGISLDDVKEMDFSPKEFEAYQLKDGDILLSEASGSASEVGKPAIWRNDVEDCCFQNTLIRVRSRGPLPEYLHLHFLADARLGKFAAAGKGIGINHLGADRMSSWPTALPPLNEQRRIVAKLDALQARSRRAREALDAVPPLLEKLRQSILAAAFRGDLTKDWRAKHKEVEPASELLKRIRTERRKKWEEAELAKMKAKGKAPTDDKWKAKYKEPEPVDATGLPQLPTGWCWASASELCEQVVDCHNKTAPYVASGVPLIRTTNIRNGRIDLTDTKFVENETYEFWSRRCPPQPGDVIFTREAPMGEAGMVPPETRLCMGQRMMLLRADGKLLRGGFLLYAVQAPHVGAYADRLSVGTGVRHLRVGDVEALPIPFAPLLEQKAIEEAVDRAFARHSASRAATEDLMPVVPSLERAVLAKAFRGELVPQDQNDEPADMMLARVRATNGAATNGARGETAKQRRPPRSRSAHG